jgi:serine/threonine-protein kinase RsbT
MRTTQSERLPLRTDEDVVRVRLAARAWMIEQGFLLLKQTKMVTATSELARNAVTHGGGGEALLECLEEGERRGLRVTVEDHGRGIANLEQAMQGGFSTGGGLGLGLSGSKQLVDEFDIHSALGKGTCVTITTWK